MIRVGTAGWSYTSGKGKWMGVFYPSARVDPLEFYAHFFEIVEVNSTFYRPLTPQMAETWARKAPERFQFSVKLYQKFTHPKMFAQATGGAAAEVSVEDFREFSASVAPLKDAGKLGPLLAQYPPSFRRSDAATDQLRRLADQLHGYAIVVELRHRSWMQDEKALELLRDSGLSWVHTDEPFISSAGGTMPLTGPIAYLRFHGRNAQEWWRGDSDERYNYLYSLAEQSQLAQRITAIPSIAPDTYVVYNNHFGGKAVANALQMKLLLGQDIRPDVPRQLLNAFPELAQLIAQEAVERDAPSVSF